MNNKSCVIGENIAKVVRGNVDLLRIYENKNFREMFDFYKGMSNHVQPVCITISLFSVSVLNASDPYLGRGLSTTFLMQ